MSRPCSTDVWVELSAVHAPVLRALSLKASRWFKKLEKMSKKPDAGIQPETVELVSAQDMVGALQVVYGPTIHEGPAS